MYRVLAYRGTLNLGDAIQAVAISRLLPGKLTGIYRDQMHVFAKGDKFVVNGFLRGMPNLNDQNLILAGIYIEPKYEKAFSENWLNDINRVIGARDPATAASLRKKGLPVEMVGCATSTLPRYTGERSGVLVIDVPPPEDIGEHTRLTMTIDAAMPWECQWNNAITRLDELASAKLVVTNRLHVAVPCMAMGTPVIVPKVACDQAPWPERLSLLDYYGLKHDVPCEVDLTPFAQAHKRFLSEQIGENVIEHDPLFYEPIVYP